MLDTLTDGFKSARLKLAGKTRLSEDNIAEALTDVRRSHYCHARADKRKHGCS